MGPQAQPAQQDSLAPPALRDRPVPPVWSAPPALKGKPAQPGPQARPARTDVRGLRERMAQLALLGPKERLALQGLQARQVRTDDPALRERTGQPDQPAHRGR